MIQHNRTELLPLNDAPAQVKKCTPLITMTYTMLQSRLFDFAVACAYIPFSSLFHLLALQILLFLWQFKIKIPTQSTHCNTKPNHQYCTCSSNHSPAKLSLLRVFFIYHLDSLRLMSTNLCILFANNFKDFHLLRQDVLMFFGC